jgi:WD40 repeat protein
MGKLYLILFLSMACFGLETLKPLYSLKATGGVQSIVSKDKLLYAGTDNGTIDIFNLSNKKKINTIKLPKIKNFTGENINTKIYSLDLFENTLLITSEGEGGYRDIYIYKDKKLERIIDAKSKLITQKANFVSKEQIILAFLSNQIALYDLKSKKYLYTKQLSMSSFSHFMISEDKTKIVSTDESGIVRIVDIKTGKVIKQLPALNLDKVYQVDYKSGVVLTAGQDRKAVVYTNSGSSYRLDFNFLLYSCALNPKGTRGAIAYNEQNEVLVFDILTKKYLYNLIGQDATMTQILFINDKELIVTSDSEKINYFKLGEKK